MTWWRPKADDGDVRYGRLEYPHRPRVRAMGRNLWVSFCRCGDTRMAWDWDTAMRFAHQHARRPHLRGYTEPPAGGFTYWV